MQSSMSTPRLAGRRTTKYWSMCFFAAFASVSLDTTYRNKNSYTICAHTIRVHDASACKVARPVSGHQTTDMRDLCNAEEISANAQR